eukprot:GHUV01019253.1.p1 GENE.GHUV01019253.1~~GHUV01019253.1.p1  ORF type:complete len:192 (+),score=18.97 GHUV01019253.1:595-1170(+)
MACFNNTDDGLQHYRVLGLPRTAAQDDIKQAYRRLARTLHPDKGGNSTAFAALQAAFETLIDPRTRSVYDALAADVRFRPGAAAPYTPSNQVICCIHWTPSCCISCYTAVMASDVRYSPQMNKCLSVAGMLLIQCLCFHGPEHRPEPYTFLELPISRHCYNRVTRTTLHTRHISLCPQNAASQGDRAVKCT